jgi:SAM-dependent methyltransferase
MTLWLPLLLLAGLVLNGMRLRSRISPLRVLPPSSAGPGAALLLVAEGVSVDPATRAGAEAYAAAEGLDVLDLVPRGLSAIRALDLARMTDARQYRAARLAPGRGAAHALLASADVRARAGLSAGSPLAVPALAALTRRLKRYAPTTMDLVVAPGLRGRPDDPHERRTVIQAVFGAGIGTTLVLAPPAVVYAGLVASVVLRPWWGLAAVAAFCLQPYLVFAGTPLRPRDLHRAVLLRFVLDPLNWARTITSRARIPAADDHYAEREAQYTEDLRDGTARFFESRRDTCPWCGSGSLSRRLRTTDLIQRKPGRFTLDECGDCGHVFQNPRLSLAGLEFYYRDFYDGAGEDQTELLFATSGGSYRARAEMVQPFTTPQRWLDVGGGHGHFCNVARDVWPETSFDVLDMGATIEEAQARGWARTAHRGMFPDLAGSLAGQYDVVSMYHYLEHTREPLEELDSAWKVLHNGGHLLIEMPNPCSRTSRILRRYWVPWFQPQHQHLIPPANLVRALEERGFTTLAVTLGPAHQTAELTAAVALTISGTIPNPKHPWIPGRPGGWRSKVQGWALTAALPLLVLTVIGDQLIGLALRRTQGGNAYRVVAHRPADA